MVITISVMRDNNLPRVRCRDKKMNWSDQTSGSDPFTTGGDNILNMDMSDIRPLRFYPRCDSCLRSSSSCPRPLQPGQVSDRQQPVQAVIDCETIFYHFLSLGSYQP